LQLYTSGTTGRPKGVMLRHSHIMTSAWAGSDRVFIPGVKNTHLSYMPLSHIYERTIDHMMLSHGYPVGYCQSPAKLFEDMACLHPTVIVGVPRIFNRMYAAIQAQVDPHGGAGSSGEYNEEGKIRETRGKSQDGGWHRPGMGGRERGHEVSATWLCQHGREEGEGVARPEFNGCTAAQQSAS